MMTTVTEAFFKKNKLDPSWLSSLAWVVAHEILEKPQLLSYLLPFFESRGTTIQ